ncbi:ethanolamine utilization protein EutH, partial [Turicibacter sanguinis]|nr:ethanolamine utilization protein EutH [Turicibacter sanguinis]
MITDLIFYVVAIFFVIGGLDFMMGNRMGLGECFERGIKSIGVLTLNMLGIFLLAPVFSDVLSRVLTPIATLFQMDPSILIGTFLACDMGGYQLSMELANSTLMGEFSGMVIASGLGATISFSIPVAFG